MSTWQGRCPLKKTPEFSQSFLGLYCCFLGGPTESQAPEGSQGLCSVELFSPVLRLNVIFLSFLSLTIQPVFSRSCLNETSKPNEPQLWFCEINGTELLVCACVGWNLHLSVQLVGINNMRKFSFKLNTVFCCDLKAGQVWDLVYTKIKDDYVVWRPQFPNQIIFVFHLDYSIGRNIENDNGT